jgi:hypothetical protein
MEEVHLRESNEIALGLTIRDTTHQRYVKILRLSPHGQGQKCNAAGQKVILRMGFGSG